MKSMRRQNPLLAAIPCQTQIPTHSNKNRIPNPMNTDAQMDTKTSLTTFLENLVAVTSQLTDVVKGKAQHNKESARKHNVLNASQALPRRALGTT